MPQREHRVLAAVSQTMLLSANKSVNCEHRRADKQSGQDEHHAIRLRSAGGGWQITAAQTWCY